MKPHGFDKKAFEDDLYHWSSLRSSYCWPRREHRPGSRLRRRTVIPFGAGWYWNPWYSAYTFIPGDGFFYNPFGWGFYSPFFAYQRSVRILRRIPRVQPLCSSGGFR